MLHQNLHKIKCCGHKFVQECSHLLLLINALVTLIAIAAIAQSQGFERLLDELKIKKLHHLKSSSAVPGGGK